jgi:hypothetical protein
MSLKAYIDINHGFQGLISSLIPFNGDPVWPTAIVDTTTQT